jgi:hypothetical protein
MTTKTKRKAPDTDARTSVSFKLTAEEAKAFEAYRARIDVPPSLNALAKACALAGIDVKNKAAREKATARKGKAARS